MPLKVDGLKELVRDLEAAGVQVVDLRLAFGGIAKEATSLAAGFAPRRSGKLARSLRGSSAKNYATVTAGGSRVPYAAPINYGWKKRNVVASGFMQKADAAIQPLVMRRLVTAVDKLLSERKLS
jgi:phage gpG-like protein